jgi:hypothetical protein
MIREEAVFSTENHTKYPNKTNSLFADWAYFAVKRLSYYSVAGLVCPATDTSDAVEECKSRFQFVSKPFPFRSSGLSRIHAVKLPPSERLPA